MNKLYKISCQGHLSSPPRLPTAAIVSLFMALILCITPETASFGQTPEGSPGAIERYLKKIGKELDSLAGRTTGKKLENLDCKIEKLIIRGTNPNEGFVLMGKFQICWGNSTNWQARSKLEKPRIFQKNDGFEFRFCNSFKVGEQPVVTLGIGKKNRNCSSEVYYITNELNNKGIRIRVKGCFDRKNDVVNYIAVGRWEPK
jgi:hypothetical protein